ncbi:TetR/AcrR family transcriptional regulator [Aliikangiella coralliicola]|uniref:TetR/AcrR family transcriptional regulator n=1 Tax=Aliikangiella coralliicola TaxID=2592383 RepID=A0A545UK28_9GAMM|nr:TetR/AcrR family transcriptional regulator [Aliikangiella coralliicola]TQV89822.1 TetR/AcrR family transcriptional regulator [Aliikangiella coralliicola]
MVRKKNPQQTRQQILEVTADLLHRHGYKGLRVDEVVEKTGLTKGAIYHHFPNKQALGYAVVDELLHKVFLEHWNKLLETEATPLEIISLSFECPDGEMSEDNLEIGCPLTNLGQEMSYDDEGFRFRINSVFDNWSNQIADLLRKGIEDGSVKPDVNPIKTARFLVSSFQGIQCNSKCTKDLERYHENVDYLRSIIQTLANPVTA